MHNSQSTPRMNESARLAIDEAGQRKKFEVVFANPETGKAYTRITRTFYRLRKLAGISKMRIHSCRHQYADRVLAAGGSLYSVQMLLGHADPRVSQRYSASWGVQRPSLQRIIRSNCTVKQQHQQKEQAAIWLDGLS